ncbi:MAG: cupin domain-containing protein [Pseudolysinimonas sp.]
MTASDDISLTPGAAVDAAALPLTREPYDPAQVVAGAPETGLQPLGTLGDLGDLEVGIWEMTPGTATDTETDEVFVVLSGRATLRFDSVPDAAPPAPIELRPGVVVRLAAGMRTTWIVHETLRKVYLA